ncbi:MAG: hypothetical protein PF637_07435 [Spirochaetes bacterium]|jgi:hypothetical protein|nr:hypothetical protein [Spirochaetota bacterium]
MYKNSTRKKTLLLFIKELMIILPVSALIGSAVGIPVILYLGDSLLEGVMRSILSAIIIGFFATLSFAWMFKTIRTNSIYAFAILFGIIAFGSALGAAINGIKSPVIFLFIITFAEILGILFALYMHKKSVELNRQLNKKQDMLL